MAFSWTLGDILSLRALNRHLQSPLTGGRPAGETTQVRSVWWCQLGPALRPPLLRARHVKEAALEQPARQLGGTEDICGFHT